MTCWSDFMRTSRGVVREDGESPLPARCPEEAKAPRRSAAIPLPIARYRADLWGASIAIVGVTSEFSASR